MMMMIAIIIMIMIIVIFEDAKRQWTRKPFYTFGPLQPYHVVIFGPLLLFLGDGGLRA